MAKQTILVLLDVNEDKLPQGNAYSELPSSLNKVLSKIQAVDLEAVYLLNPKSDIKGALHSIALNYHHYAVAIRGEKCEEDNCEQHPITNVIALNDHTSRSKNAPGVN